MFPGGGFRRSVSVSADNCGIVRGNDMMVRTAQDRIGPVKFEIKFFRRKKRESANKP